MNHDLELLRDAKGFIKPYDKNGNYNSQWFMQKENKCERILFTRYYYQNDTEVLSLFLFPDGSVFIADMKKGRPLLHSF